MEIYDYHSSGGKNVILNYVEKLTKQEQLEIYDTREEIRKSGMDAFEKLNTRNSEENSGKSSYLRTA